MLFKLYLPLVRDPEHYYLEAVPEPDAGGPRPDDIQRAYCYEDECTLDLQKLRPCINYTLNFLAHALFDETGERFTYIQISFVTKPEGMFSRRYISSNQKWLKPKKHH